jgi:tetratricopeptide (TPR) repeat protein
LEKAGSLPAFFFVLCDPCDAKLLRSPIACMLGGNVSAMQNNQRDLQPSRGFDWLIPGVIIVGLLHAVSALSPSVRTWGLDYWSLLPTWGQLLMLVLLAIAAIPQVSLQIANSLDRQNWPRWSGYVCLALVFGLFLALRSKAYSYGDSYTFLELFPDGSMPPISGNMALMSGDIISHWLVYRAVVMPLGGSVGFAYAVVSALAGVASLLAIAAIARTMYPKDRRARWMIIAAGISSGMAAIWFGHVEAYSLVGAALLWCLSALIGERSAMAWGLWVFACALHLLAVAFLPVVLIATLGRRLLVQTPTPRTLLYLLLGFVGWGVAGAVLSMVKPGIFVPFLSTADSAYSAFSLAHLADSANLLLFAAPLGVLGVAAWLLRSTIVHKDDNVSAIAVLAIASASLWYFAFWIDPLIGAFRDWDLLGTFGIPLSLLGGALLARRATGQVAAKPQWVVVGAFVVVHSGAFVLGARDETKAMERVDRMVREDVHYSRDFYKGERRISWAYVLTHVVDDKERAIDHLRQRAQWEPADLSSWNNLGSIYWHLQQYDSAVVCFEKSLELDPNDIKTLEMLSYSYSASQQWPEARRSWERLSELRELRPLELNALAFGLLMTNDTERADSLIGLSLSRDPNQREGFYYLGIVNERRLDTVAALANYERAMSPQSEVEDVYSRAVKLYQARGQWVDAARVGTAWMAQFPNSPSAPFFVGISRVAIKDYAGASDALERAATADPNSALTAFYLATAYRNLGQTDRAVAAANRSAAIDPTLALPYLELVYLAADRGDHASAVAATTEYLKRAPYDSGMSYLQQFMEP